MEHWVAVQRKFLSASVLNHDRSREAATVEEFFVFFTGLDHLETKKGSLVSVLPLPNYSETLCEVQLELLKRTAPERAFLSF